MKTILTTEPHGAQTVRELEPESELPTGNRLFTLQSTDGNAVVMTGEELTSLARQWLDWLNKVGNTNCNP